MSNSGARWRLVCLMTHSKPGGAQNALLRLAEELGRRGHHVEVWPLYGPVTATGPTARCRIVVPQETPGALGYLRIPVRLVRRLKSVRPDAVISFMPLANVVGQLAAWAAGIPGRVASQRNPCWTYQPIMRACDRLVGSIGIYTQNVANSESVRESFVYSRAYRRRMVVVQNGLSWQSSALTRGEARAKFGLPFERPVIVNVGRLAEQKDQSLLLAVLARLPEAHLAIAGEGELRDMLHERAASLRIDDRVHFLGHLDEPSVADLLVAADVFAQPSLYEGQSNALLEALNAGLAIVVSDIPAQVEALCGKDSEPAGLIAPLRDEAAWVSTLARILHDADLRQRLAARARARSADFGIGRMVDGFEAAVQRSVRSALSLESQAVERLDKHSAQ